MPDFDRIRKQFDTDKSEEYDVRKEAAIDQRFVAGGEGQWDPDALKQRKDAGRPILSFNRLDGPVNLVANEARQNKPSIKFSPSDDPADKETAEILEGLARAIQYDSDADTAYETALRCSAGSSFGYFRLKAEYEDPRSFNVDLKVAPVIDPFSVYGILIPSCLGQKPRHSFVLESITHDDFKRKYPDAELTRQGFDSEFAKQGDLWVSENRVQIAEYWEIQSRPVRIALLDDGRVVDFNELPKDGSVRPRAIRTTEEDTITSFLTNGLEVLGDSETTWPGTCIPIFLVPGEVQIVDGKVKLYSVIRFSRDPQQLLNFAKCRLAEFLGTSPISPWLAAEWQLEGHETEWNEAHLKPTNVLYFKTRDAEGNPVGAPIRNTFEPPIAALSAFIAQENDDIKASTKIYDASLGAAGPEISGRAINARQRQSSLSNLHYTDNLNRAHRICGREMAIVIQKFYDGARRKRILGEDESERMVMLNAPFVDPETKQEKMYDLTAGKYDIRVSTGPAYTTKREEAFSMFTELARAYPQLMEVIGDIIMRNSDIPGAEEAAERLKKMLPAQLQEEQQGAAEVPPEVQAQLQQAEQIVQQLQAQLEELRVQADTNASKERIEHAKLELQREEMHVNADLELKKIGSQETLVDLVQRVAAIEHVLTAEPEPEPDPDPEPLPQPEIPVEPEPTTLPEEGLPLAA